MVRTVASMGWFRRTRPTPLADATDETALVPVPTAATPVLARTERALQLLASQSAELHSSIVRLEGRVDAMAERMIDPYETASQVDVIETRLQTAKVAAEVSRLEINVAARIDQIRAEVRGPVEIDLRARTPADTGF